MTDVAPTGGDSVLIFVNGERHSGNPADIVLANGQEIAIVISSPPKQIPSHP